MSTPMPNNRNSGGGKCSLLLSLWLLLAASSGHVVTRMRGFDGPLPFYLETGYALAAPPRSVP
jgi:serine carboxypeptidase-like clade 1